MSAPAPEAPVTPPAAPAKPPAAPQGTPPAPPAAPPAPPAADPAAENVDQLPAWAQKIIRDTRKEAGDSRTAKTAAETQAQSILAAVAKAAGIQVEGEKPDPAKLTADLTTAQQAQADTARQLAIYKAASAAGADPAKLLDSNSFMTSVQGLDPTDGEAVAAAITAAVTANTSLKAARAAGASGIEQTGGTGEQGQITEQQLKTMTPNQIVAAQEKGLLRNLLG